MAAAADDVVEAPPPFDEGDYFQEYPVVLAVTRLPQTVAQAPTAISVIDRAMIEASGFRELYQVFRLVPGMLVGVEDGSTQGVAYHSLSDVYARRMQVLIDGRSVYTPAWAGVYWSDLPITLDDIERIEVVRGPDSANYGSNALLGVINIVTREPVLDLGTSVRAHVGDDGVRETYLRHAGQLGTMDYRLTLGFSEDDGIEARYDGKRTRLLNFRAGYQLGSRDELDLLLGVAEGDRETENPLSVDTSPPRVRGRLSHFGQLGWQRSFDVENVLSLRFTHSVHDNDERFTTNEIIDPVLVYDPPRIPLDWSLRTERYDIELEHRFRPFDALRLLWSAGFRQDKARSKTLFNSTGEESSQLRTFSFNGEWQFTPRWSLHLGGLVEDNSIAETAPSSLVALNYRLMPGHVLRLTASRADRVPTLIESAADWEESARIVSPVERIYSRQLLVGNPDLSPERIYSRQLGYNGTFLRGGLTIDLNFFYDKLDHIITQNDHIPGVDTMTFADIDTMTIKGGETELFYRPRASWWGKFAYAYTVVRGSDLNQEVVYSDSGPRHNVSLLLASEAVENYLFSAGFYFLSEMQGWDENGLRDPIRRLDLRVARHFEFDTTDLELALVLQNILGDYEGLQLLRPRHRYGFINEVGQTVYLSAKASFL